MVEEETDGVVGGVHPEVGMAQAVIVNNNKAGFIPHLWTTAIALPWVAKMARARDGSGPALLLLMRSRSLTLCPTATTLIRAYLPS